jgi:alkylation response protein AidB-like acyl-CoA dehydrogenase
MPLAYDKDQLLFADTVEQFLADLPSGLGAKHLTQDDAPPDAAHLDPLWSRITTELDLVGLPIADNVGGGGATWCEVGIALEAAGRRLLVAPYLSTMTGIRLLEATGAPEAETLLARVARDGLRVMAAVEASAFADSAFVPTLQVTASGRLRGEVRAVLDGALAEVLLCPAQENDALVVYAVDAANAIVTPLPSLDITRGLAAVRLDDAPGIRLVTSTGSDAVREALLFASAAIALESIGGAERCLQLTVDYAKTRQQFGQTIGRFQAIKHSCADLVRRIEPAKAAAYAAMEAVAAHDPDLPRLASVAAYSAVEAFVATAGTAIQLHGAIGFTWEHELHLHFKRAITNRTLFGSNRQHRRLLAQHLLGEVSLASSFGPPVGEES